MKPTDFDYEAFTKRTRQHIAKAKQYLDTADTKTRQDWNPEDVMAELAQAEAYIERAYGMQEEISFFESQELDDEP